MTGGVSCPVSAAWNSCVAAHVHSPKHHCYKKASSRYDLRFLKATLKHNKQIYLCNVFRNDLITRLHIAKLSRSRSR